MKSYEETKTAIKTLIESDTHIGEDFWSKGGVTASPAYNTIHQLLDGSPYSEERIANDGCGLVVPRITFSHIFRRAMNRCVPDAHHLTILMGYPEVIRTMYGDCVLNGHKLEDMINAMYALRSEYKSRMKSKVPNNVALWHSNHHRQIKVKALLCQLYHYLSNHDWDNAPELNNAAWSIPSEFYKRMKRLAKMFTDKDITLLRINVDEMHIVCDRPASDIIDILKTEEVAHMFGRGIECEYVQNLVLLDPLRFVQNGKAYGMPTLKATGRRMVDGEFMDEPMHKIATDSFNRAFYLFEGN